MQMKFTHISCIPWSPVPFERPFGMKYNRKSSNTCTMYRLNTYISTVNSFYMLGLSEKYIPRTLESSDHALTFNGNLSRDGCDLKLKSKRVSQKSENSSKEHG